LTWAIAREDNWKVAAIFLSGMNLNVANRKLVAVFLAEPLIPKSNKKNN
jgi:hypothetical protein